MRDTVDAALPAPDSGREMLARLSEGFCPRGHDRLGPDGGCVPCGVFLAFTHLRPGCRAFWRVEQPAPADTMIVLAVYTASERGAWCWPAGLWAHAGPAASRLVERDLRRPTGRRRS